ncbi:hypothetical protein B0T14DRAFT_35 [Immersiella caudata]|uniref:Aminoglycoside phosphotransferase domain-containing protein n=1 Tax=Immersiella caudata TaxID=314043 RepID=A0AA40CB87_9PEZI|nr:hypothetical protein B0T14DRAFT_35 [Immersiella caudata]
MPSVRVADAFPSLVFEENKNSIHHIALVFKAIQSFQLPPSVKGFDGLNFDDNGDIITGPTPIHGGRPCDTVAGLYTEYFHTQISCADKCDIVKGWRATSLRDRLDKFGAEKLPQLLREVESQLTPRPTLVHADFDLHNLLFDPSTNQLTALLDFDFGHVASHADEYFYPFDSLMHIVVPPTVEEPDMVSLWHALLYGFPQELPVPKEGDKSVGWKLAAAVNKAFANAGVNQPSEIPGIDELSALYWCIQDVSPPLFF